MGAVASATMTEEALTPQSNISPCETFSIVNHPLLSPPTTNIELSSSTSVLSQLLAVSTDVVTSTAISNPCTSKPVPRLLQGPSAKFLPGKHRKRRPMPCSIVEEECAEIVEEEEELEEEDEEIDDCESKITPSVCLNRRGSGGSAKSGHVFSAGILSTEPALHSSTPPLPIVPLGTQTNLLSVRRRSSDRSSNSSRSSDGAVGAKVGSPVERGTNSPKTPAPFPISSQIGSGSLSRQGSLNRGRASDRSAATSHSSTPNSVSERSSPSSPPGSNTSSNHSSPVARTRINLTGSGGGVGIGVITSTGRQHKLVATRSSPQLIHHATQPALKEIHEECEETGTLSGAGSVTGSPVTISSGKGANHGNVESVQIDPRDSEPLSIVDSFPSTREGAAVIRRLEQRRRLRMHQARATSCSSSEASEDETGSSGSVHSKVSKPLSSALLHKGATTLARISERPHSSPGTSQRSGKKRHGIIGAQNPDSEGNGEEKEKLSPFQSACTQPRLRKGRENSNQDDSSDNQDSGAPCSKGGGNSSHILASSADVQNSMDGEEKREDDNGDQNTGSQENNDTNEADNLSNLNSNISQQPIHPLEKSCHNSYSDSTWDNIKNESTRKDITSRKESVDSTEDSGEWDDPELISFLPHFLTSENEPVEPRIQFSDDESSPSSLEFASKSPSPKSSLTTRASLKSATSGFPILTQRLAKIQEGQIIANDGEMRGIEGSTLKSDLRVIRKDKDTEDDYLKSSIECPRIPVHSELQRPIHDINIQHPFVRDGELQVSNRIVNAPVKEEFLPSKYQMIKKSLNDKPLYRAHSCGSLFSMQHSNHSGLITVRHRRLSSQLCLPVDSLPGIAVSSLSNSRSAHVTATVFIDIYAPYSPASPTLTGSPASSPSSGDDMLSFKGIVNL